MGSFIHNLSLLVRSYEFFTLCERNLNFPLRSSAQSFLHDGESGLCKRHFCSGLQTITTTMRLASLFWPLYIVFPALPRPNKSSFFFQSYFFLRLECGKLPSTPAIDLSVCLFTIRLELKLLLERCFKVLQHV